MPWVRVDDGYADHPKVAAVGPLGQALWLAGLAYCNRNLTDGFIPWAIAQSLVSWTYMDGSGVLAAIYVGTPSMVHEEGAVTSEYVIEVLLAGGLWEEAPGGYRVHDYGDYQPTKAQVMAERAAKIAAGRAGGLASAQARGQAPAVADRVAGAQAKSKPVPKPVPVPNPVSDPLALAGENVAREGFEEPEGEALTWLARHGCDIRPGNGYHQKLVLAVENYGVNAVVGMFDRLEGAGVKRGDIKGFVFGAIDALNGKPDLRGLEREDRAEDERARIARSVARTKAMTAERDRQVSS